MALLKSLAAFSAGAASLFAVSFAGDIAACPDEYPIMATDYVESSLVDARGARVQIVSEPYRVSADVSGYDDVQGWGVDVRVRSRLPGGRYSDYVGYTVIFVNGEPVALCDDTDQLARV